MNNEFKVEKITLKLSELAGAIDSITGILQCKLPLKTSYRLVRLKRSLANEFEIFEEQRLILVDRYVLKENDKPVIKDKAYQFGDNDLIFQEEFKRLADTVTEVECIKFEIEDFGESLEVVGTYIDGLYPFIKE